MAYVYLLRNMITAKIYVGYAHCPSRRVKKHISALKSGRHTNENMQEDSNTFGYETFTYSVMGPYDGHEASRMEVFMMKILRTQDSRFGYNYKDRAGSSVNAINDRWRTPPSAWVPMWRKKFLEGRVPEWHVSKYPYHGEKPVIIAKPLSKTYAKPGSAKVTIKAARVNIGLSRKEFGNAVGVSKETVFDWEHGKRPIKPIYWDKICEVTGFSRDEFALPWQQQYGTNFLFDQEETRSKTAESHMV